MKKLLLLSGWLLLGFILTTVRAAEVYDTLRWTWEAEAGEEKSFSFSMAGVANNRYDYYVDFGDGTYHEANCAGADTTCPKVYHQTGTYDVMIVVSSPGGRITRFDCSGDWDTYNRVTLLDVKHCTALAELRCSFNQLTSLDVSKNVNLTSLYCDTNQLTKLNISENIRLETLVCGGNCLTSLDVSKNVNLTFLTCDNNRLALSALAGIRNDISYYYAYPQMITRNVSAGEVLDWRSEMRFDIAETQVDFGGIPSEAYAFTDGYLVFHQPGEYRLSMRNERITSDRGKPINVYYDIIVTTPPEPEEPTAGVCDTIFMTWEAEAGESKLLGLSLSGSDKGGGFWIDFGNGYRYESGESYQDTMVSYAQSGTYNVTIATTSPDIRVTRFNCIGFYGKPNNGVTALDVSRCTDLKTLTCGSNGLSKLDISQNRNLTSLSCDSCRLSALDISQNVNLKDLSCSYNRMPLSALAELRASVGYDCWCHANPQEITGDVSTGEVLDWRSEMRFDMAETGVNFWAIPSEAYAFTNGYVVFYQPGEYDVSMWNDSVAMNYGGSVEPVDVFYHFTVTGDPITPPAPEEPTAGVCDTIFLTWEAEAGAERRLAVALSEAACFWMEDGAGHRYECMASQVGEWIDGTIYYEHGFDTALIYGQSGIYDITIGTFSPDVRITGFNCGLGNRDFNGVVALEVSKSPALMFLECAGNRLTSLDVSQNVALTRLFCSENQLTSLDVSRNVALMELGCNENHLTSLDVSKNAALKRLYCYNNQLTSLDVSRNVALEVINCSNNQLTSLDVSRNAVLKDLECYNNQLAVLDVSQNPALMALFCSGNQLTSLDVSGCFALETLSCSNNQLTALDVSGCLALKELNCDRNRLTSLDVSGNAALTSLICGDNQLTSLDVSGNAVLTYLTCGVNQLTRLDVSGNTILAGIECHFNRMPLSVIADLLKNVPDTLYECYVSPQRIADTLAMGEMLDWRSEMLLNGVATEKDFDKVPGDAYTFEDGRLVFNQPGEYQVSLRNAGLLSDEGWLDEKHQVASEVYYHITVTGDSITPPEEPENPVPPVDPDTLVPGAGVGLVWEAAAGGEKEIEFALRGRGGVRVDWGDGTADERRGASKASGGASASGDAVSASKDDDDDELKHRYAQSGVYTVTVTPTGSASLVGLDVSDERVLALTLGDSTRIEELDCSENLLAYLDLGGAACLEELDCSENLLTTLDLSGCPNLREVDFSENRLTGIDLSANRNLREVDGEENRMRLSTLYTLLSNRNRKASYEFDPQGDSAALSSGEWLDLGSEMTIGDRNTTYTVRYAETRKTVPAESYEEQGGRFRFLEEGRSYLLTLQNRNVTDYEDGVSDDRVSFTWCVRVSGVANEGLVSAASADAVWAYVSGRTIYVTDAVDVNSEEVAVYTAVGQLVYRGHGHAIDVPQAGVYILTAGDRRMKVLVR